MLADCTLCPNKEDPRWGLMTKEGDYYPLCDGCAPDPGTPQVAEVAARCKAMGPPFGNTTTVPRFGVNEDRTPRARSTGKGNAE
jgi:hypothetical protein